MGLYNTGPAKPAPKPPAPKPAPAPTQTPVVGTGQPPPGGFTQTGGTHTGPPPKATDPGSALTGANRDAYQSILNLFTSYGLGSLAPNILQYVQQGYSADTISILLQQTDAYKQRFAGNELRKKAGLAVLSPADYLATEDSYKQIMRSAGLPAGFYDSPTDFVNFIGQDVSPTEMNSRVQLASSATVTASPYYKQALSDMGLSHGDMTAYFLDPGKAVPLLQQQATTAAIGSEALARGLGFDQGYATRLAQAGFSQSQAAQGYSQISQEFQTLRNIAGQFGQTYNYGQEEQAVFQPGAGTAGSGADLNAAQFQQRLASWQRANVSGNVGGAQGGLARHGGGQLV
jgi:hypothetical protein